MRQKPRLGLHTLGPAGTNCEAAARHWLNQRGDGSGHVLLHDTLEKAVAAVLAEPNKSALLGCIVYPRLHEIVFQNLRTMSLRECFVFPTYRMVLACRPGGAGGPGPAGAEGTTARAGLSVGAGERIITVISHPAPVNLLDGLDVQISLADSNSQAARSCARREVDACVTTIVAAEANGLRVIKDFGPVSMGYSIHAPHDVKL